MSNPNDLYPTTTGISELSMREELTNTIDGKFPEIAKSTKGILRKMRKDSAGALIECPCVDPITREPDKDYYCPICLTEKYLFDESYIYFYKVPFDRNQTLVIDKIKGAGIFNVPLATFYLKHDVNLEKADKLIELDLDSEGAVKTPIKRIAVWRIQEHIAFRLDNGRLEFLKTFCSLEDVKYLNPK